MILSTGCVAPENIEKEYSVLGGSCVEVGKSMEAVEGCLNIKFTQITYQDKIVKDFSKCKPYWGWPFVQSCVGINIIYNESKIVTKWFAWGELDGL